MNSNYATGAKALYRHTDTGTCDRSIVVLPGDVADRASKRLELFESLDVGLWSFDPDSDVITKYFTPHQGTARNLEARNKAIESILNKIQLCKALK